MKPVEGKLKTTSRAKEVASQISIKLLLLCFCFTPPCYLFASFPQAHTSVGVPREVGVAVRSSCKRSFPRQSIFPHHTETKEVSV